MNSAARKYFLIWPLITMALLACVDNIDIEAPDNEDVLVVEGLVASVEGESFVRLSLSRTIALDNPGLDTLGNSLVRGARVSVSDNLGNVEPFNEIAPGTYMPVPGFRGIVGSSYTLNVSTIDGKQYRSEPDTLYPALSLRELIIRYEENQFQGQLEGFHEFFLVLENEPDEHFFRVLSTGVAEVGAFLDPAPPLCGPPCAEICYSYREPVDNQIRVLSNQGFDGSELTLRAAMERYDFSGFYLFTSRLYSLSRSASDFWESASVQTEINGDIFDPQLPPLEGNVLSVSGEDEVFGFFGASDIQEIDTVFNRGLNGPSFAPGLPTGTSCPAVWRGGSYVRPDRFP
ncbi:MAG: DUF4249 domain-containing protein [Bacteroidota bacterium]